MLKQYKLQACMLGLEKLILKYDLTFYRWFLHFYLVGFLVNGGLLAIIVRSYYFGDPIPKFIQKIVHNLRSDVQYSKTSTGN